jgi:hypothetical protein
LGVARPHFWHADTSVHFADVDVPVGDELLEVLRDMDPEQGPML